MYLKKLDEEVMGFKRIKGYDGYFINSQGVIINAKRETLRVMEPKVSSTGQGYYTVGLRDSEGVRTFHMVHRLVALTFINTPRRIDNLYINHIDGNTLNNNYTNLEWVSAKENAIHAMNSGVCREQAKRSCIYFENVFVKEFEKKQDAIDFICEKTGYSFDAVRKHFTNLRPIQNFPKYSIVENKKSNVLGVKSHFGGWTANITVDGKRYSKDVGKSYDEAVKLRLLYEALYLKTNSHSYDKGEDMLKLTFESLDDGLSTSIHMTLNGTITLFTKHQPPQN